MLGCTQPAELLDIYPTLIDLCGLSRRDDLEGISLSPQLMDANAPRERPAITSHNQGNHGIRQTFGNRQSLCSHRHLSARP